MNPLALAPRPLIIGHRGYCGIAPENTLPSFQLALDAGAKFIEFDVQQSQDGELMVIHDDTLDRTTDARKRWRKKRIRVADKTAAQIGALDTGSWFDPKFAGARIVPLAEAIQFIHARGGTAVIERKSGDAETCARALRAGNWIGKVVLLSFDWRFLRRFHQLEPSQRLGALGKPTHLADGRKPSGLTKRFSVGYLDQIAGTGAELVVWNCEISPAGIAAIHDRGIKVWVYTVNDPKLALWLRDAGVDGIITNRVAEILDVLR
jgi:glycerophosphoryl diester phosphodiesterase